MAMVNAVKALAAFANSISALAATPPAAKPAVSGAKGGSTALASLLTALASYGWDGALSEDGADGVVFFNLAVTAITNTSGTGMVNVSMPWTNAAPLTVFTGRENGATGRPLEAYLSGATLSIVYATDLAFPGATGNSLYVSGVIEATA